MLRPSEHEILEEVRLAEEPDVRIGKALFRPASRCLELNGQRQLLEPRVAQLIAALARYPDSVVSRDTLVDLCWGGRIVGEDAVNRCVAKARKAALGAGFEIATVPRVGYKLVQPERRGWRSIRGPWLIGGMAALVVTSAVGLFLWYRPAPASPLYPPIAVGEFTTNSGQPELRERTADVRSQVVDALLKTGVPMVPNRGLSSSGAAYTVRGEVSAKPDGIHAIVQMDDVATAHTVYSQELDLDRDEVSLLPDKLAAAVAGAVTRSGAYYALTAGGEPADVSAFLGISMQIAGGDYLEAELQARQFLEIRPEARLAPFALSWATIYSLPFMPIEERREAIGRGRNAALLAQRRLPEFGDAYIARCKLYPAAFASCERDLRRGLAVDRSAPAVRAQLALLLMNAGRLSEARSVMTTALARNPFNPAVVIQSLYLAQLSRDRSDEDAISAYALRYWPKLRFVQQRFISLMANGRWSEAEQIAPLVVRVAPGSEATLSAVFAALHRPTDANRDALEDMCASAAEPPAAISCIAGLSTLDRSTAALELARRFFPTLRADNPADRDARFIENGSDPGPFFFLWGAGLRSMRQDAGFASLAQQVGLLDYWRARGAPDLCRQESASVTCRLAARANSTQEQ